MRVIEEETGVTAGTSSDAVDLNWCGCLGYCAQSPNVLVGEHGYILCANEKTIMEEIDRGGTAMPGDDRTIDEAYDSYLANDPLGDL